MKTAQAIYENGDHRWLAIVRDPDRPGYLVDTNEYLISVGDDAMLLDPGGSEIFPAVFSALCAEYDPRRISKIFASHQDPDVASSLSMWLEFNPDLKCCISWLWTSFVPHYGGTGDTFITIPDGGMDIPVGREQMRAIPAHYLHSSGNFNLYDPKAKILFSGDIGAALLPPGRDRLVCREFRSPHRPRGRLSSSLDGVRAGEARLVRPCCRHGYRHALPAARRHLPW